LSPTDPPSRSRGYFAGHSGPTHAIYHAAPRIDSLSLDYTMTMTLKDFEANPTASLIYLDRYVNDGSPSGFTEINRTSPMTDPFGLNPDFNLFAIEASENDFQIYGSLSPDIPLESNQFYIHPDMVKHIDLKGCNIIKQDHFSVVPTSSCRTVKILSDTCGDYVKLHYDGIIGRINRKLNTYRAISGVELSNIIKENLTNGTLSDFISIYEEPFAKLFLNPLENNENLFWGMIWRLETPFGKRSDMISFIVPLFSLWSIDRINKEEATFGRQLFNYLGTNATHCFVDELLLPILDSYFELIVKLGLQNEYNSQNLLIGFDTNWKPQSIIFRDLMGIEKDIDIRNSIGLSNRFDSYQYKSISSYDNLYSIRHSFAFDFKVCKYVIEPLMNLTVDFGIAKRQDLIEILRDRTKYWMELLPKHYFPKGKWYSHDKILLLEKREYIEQYNPLLRD
jgi:hypothetical protein